MRVVCKLLANNRMRDALGYLSIIDYYVITTKIPGNTLLTTEARNSPDRAKSSTNVSEFHHTWASLRERNGG